MFPYQLAKLVEWAEHIDTRKRMQKLVFMLQAAGCRFDADFYLHRFGPYSAEVAELTDKLVAAGILEEKSVTNMVGRQFSYQLSESGKRQVAEVELKPEYASMRTEIENFKPLIHKLIATSLRELEVASTIAYFKESCANWNDALQLGCDYKDVEPSTAFGKKAELLARQTVEGVAE